MIETPGLKRNKVILDSSVIAAIFFKEDASERAEKAAENNSLITLDLAYVEVANVAWKRVVIFNEPEELILKALKNSSDFITGACEVIKARELLRDAFKIAVLDKITIYDSLFVAASEKERVPLLTTDGKLYEKLKKTRNIKPI